MEWIKTENKLPNSLGSYIVFFRDEYNDGVISMGWMFFNSNKEWCMDNNKYKFITHWMELPKPPME